jgi:hypothetical protein
MVLTGTLVISHGPDAGVVEWDTEHAGGNGPLDPAIVEKRFDSMVGRGMFAFAAPRGGGTVEQIKKGEFDPVAQEKVTMTPQIAGGAR